MGDCYGNPTVMWHCADLHPRPWLYTWDWAGTSFVHCDNLEGPHLFDDDHFLIIYSFHTLLFSDNKLKGVWVLWQSSSFALISVISLGFTPSSCGVSFLGHSDLRMRLCFTHMYMNVFLRRIFLPIHESLDGYPRLS